MWKQASTKQAFLGKYGNECSYRNRLSYIDTGFLMEIDFPTETGFPNVNIETDFPTKTCLAKCIYETGISYETCFRM